MQLIYVKKKKIKYIFQFFPTFDMYIWMYTLTKNARKKKKKQKNKKRLCCNLFLVKVKYL